MQEKKAIELHQSSVKLRRYGLFFVLFLIIPLVAAGKSDRDHRSLIIENISRKNVKFSGKNPVQILDHYRDSQKEKNAHDYSRLEFLSRKQLDKLKGLFHTSSDQSTEKCVERFVGNIFQSVKYEENSQRFSPAFSVMKEDKNGKSYLFILTQDASASLMLCREAALGLDARSYTAVGEGMCIHNQSESKKWIVENGRWVVDGVVTFDGTVERDLFDAKFKDVRQLASDICP